MRKLIILNKIDVDYDFSGESNFLIVTVPNSKDIVNYQVQMLGNNETEHFLPVKKVQINNAVQLYYDITNKSTLSQLMKNERIPKESLLQLISAAVRAMQEAEEYQLEDQGIVLDRKYIYMETLDAYPKFVYLPFYKESIGLKMISEFLDQLYLSAVLDVDANSYVAPLIQACNNPEMTLEGFERMVYNLRLPAPMEDRNIVVAEKNNIVPTQTPTLQQEEAPIPVSESKKEDTFTTSRDIEEMLKSIELTAFTNFTMDETEDIAPPQSMSIVEDPIHFEEEEDLFFEQPSTNVKTPMDFEEKELPSFMPEHSMEAFDPFEVESPEASFATLYEEEEEESDLFEDIPQVPPKGMSTIKSELTRVANDFDDFMGQEIDYDKFNDAVENQKAFDHLGDFLKPNPKEPSRPADRGQTAPEEIPRNKGNVVRNPRMKQEPLQREEQMDNTEFIDIESDFVKEREKEIESYIKGRKKQPSQKGQAVQEIGHLQEEDEDYIESSLEKKYAPIYFGVAQVAFVLIVAILAMFKAFQGTEGGINIYNVLITLAIIGVIDYILYKNLFATGFPKINRKPAAEVVLQKEEIIQPGKEIKNQPAKKTKAKPKEETLVSREIEDTVFVGNQKVPYLTVDVDGVTQKIFLTKPSFIIGRFVGKVDYVTQSNKVGKIHAEIIQRDGLYYVHDLNSKNGTYINSYRQRIISNIDYVIENGDVLILADVELTFHLE